MVPFPVARRNGGKVLVSGVARKIDRRGVARRRAGYASQRHLRMPAALLFLCRARSAPPAAGWNSNDGKGGAPGKQD